MTDKYEGIKTLLEVRHYLYCIFQSFFGNEPTSEQIQELLGEPARKALELYLDGDREALDLKEKIFADIGRRMENDEESAMEKLRSEYTRLFIGPGALPAPPWESVYRNRDQLLFQESTLKVRRRYLEYQLLPAKYPHEADDHLALELNFIASLCRLTLQSLDAKDVRRAEKILRDQKSFLDEHLLVWVPSFTDLIGRSSTNELYPDLSALLLKYLNADAAALNELITQLVQQH